MPRPTKEQIDDEILETAATLFARHGFKETSVQRIADAVGYSKTGLLHRYPSKEALQQAVIDRALQSSRVISTDVEVFPPGPERDHAAVTHIARLALECPGMVSLILSGLTTDPESEIGRALEEIGEAVFAAFAVDQQTDPVRLVRVIGALGALAVVSIALCDKLPADVLGVLLPADVLGVLVEVSYAALGHGEAPRQVPNPT